MRNRVAIILLLLVLGIVSAEAAVSRIGGPATTNNDDSCDIALLPAATLLLPFFEVDLDAEPGAGETTLFTVTNTTNLPQIARVTLWTDWAHPIVGFNLYLTGYDVQSINLYDVIAGGHIAPGAEMGSVSSPIGELSEESNPLVLGGSCTDLPGQLAGSLITRMRSAFTTGRIPAAGSQPACNTAGGVHENAVGYATIDVVSSCGSSLPTDAEYFEREILFDNVLMGDYQQVNGLQNYAQGSPMVHIRAIPEGGTLASRDLDPSKVRNFRRTFYSRFQPAAQRTRDGRQPLPSLFAARWIAGGTGGFQTYFKIWREGRGDGATPCNAMAANGSLGITEIVRFDDEENPETWSSGIVICTPIPFAPSLPATSLSGSDYDSVFPQNSQSSVTGWMYMNFDACNRDDFASQNWVVTSMRADGRFSSDVDALAMGNGCTPPIPQSEAYAIGTDPIGPARNPNP